MGDRDQVHAFLSCAVAVVLAQVNVLRAASDRDGTGVVHLGSDLVVVKFVARNCCDERMLVL